MIQDFRPVMTEACFYSLSQVFVNKEFAKASSPFSNLTMDSIDIPQTQTVALVRSLGSEVEFQDYPVPEPKSNEVLAKVLYTGVCQSGT